MTPPNTRDTTPEDDHVCPANERCPECHSIPLHLLHRMILERGDLTEPDFDDGPKDCPQCGEMLVEGKCEVGCEPLAKPFTELKRTGTGGWL